MQPKIRRVYFPRAKLIIGLIVGGFALIFLVKLINFASNIEKQTGISPTVLARLVFDNGSELKSTDGRTNILLLGVGGGTHDGPDLTDTMLLLSVNMKNQTLDLISIPRDIWSDTLKDKVNSAYHYGEEKKQGGGLVLSKAIAEDVVGLPIHYALLIDFSGFKDLVDLVGGIDISVSKPFVDTQYPIDGKENDLCGGDPTYACRYQTVEFKAGLQHMDGSRALIYVRSRHAEGDEGSDFARSRRQQEVIIALKQKFLTPWTWLTKQKIQALPAMLDKMTDTDMTIGELLTVGKFAGRVPQSKITKIAFDSQLTNPPLWQYDGRYVLVPTDSYEVLHTYISSQLH